MNPEIEALLTQLTERATEVDALSPGEGIAALTAALEYAVNRMDMELSRVKLEQQINELNEQTRKLRNRR